MMRFISIFILTALAGCSATAQIKIPEVYSNMGIEGEKQLYLEVQGVKLPALKFQPFYTLTGAIGNPAGTGTGIGFDFQDAGLNGVLYYGFIHYKDSKHPLPVYFYSFAPIKEGKASIDISGNLSGRYDMIGWEKSGQGTIGYRLVNDHGGIIYDGKIGFNGTGPFKIANTIIEGPFINLLKPDGATISFQTNKKIRAGIEVNGKIFKDKKPSLYHHLEISDLDPDRIYSYTVLYDGINQTYSFRTAPEPGSRKPFTFAYASDSRTGQGGGERDVYGVNAYIMKKIMAATLHYESRFFQFTGDLINGYLTDKDEMDLQYANWKRSVEAFWHHIPLYVGMGNHEALSYEFYDTTRNRRFSVDRFPFGTESSEAVFRDHFHMPVNGPESEDGAYYDPNPGKTDFPSYKESVYYYIYDNVAVIVLNSDYFYAPSLRWYYATGGNLHGYILDQQLSWLEETLGILEQDGDIDHIFVTQHTPAFPNGGHVQDDMWYGGQNQYRPYIAGKHLRKGIIERRDEFLDLLVNKSSKVVAMLTGDEHNYNRMKIDSSVVIYPEPWFLDKLLVSRPIWQINNGAAGAPYYAQEQTPWIQHVQGFTTQNALVLIHVNGKEVRLEVINPDTLETIDEAVLRE